MTRRRDLLPMEDLLKVGQKNKNVVVSLDFCLAVLGLYEK